MPKRTTKKRVTKRRTTKKRATKKRNSAVRIPRTFATGKRNPGVTTHLKQMREFATKLKKSKSIHAKHIYYGKVLAEYANVMKDEKRKRSHISAATKILTDVHEYLPKSGDNPRRHYPRKPQGRKSTSGNWYRFRFYNSRGTHFGSRIGRGTAENARHQGRAYLNSTQNNRKVARVVVDGPFKRKPKA